MRNAKPATAKPVKTPKKPAATEVMATAAVKADKMGNATKLASSRKAEVRLARSDAFEAIHSAAAALRSVGVIDKKTMRDFDESCFTPPSFTASDVLRIRNKERLSQEVLARYMGITKSTVVKWESADNVPSPMAQRLLKVIDEQGISAIA
ncbi:helix-turn-helix domain-containing protein [Janthinobacterium sp.]|uniref:helix-turn-helix domain-containing protein n=1 Tax=Janthinobacterium sp. TaxID=1871054 RepID=UPI00293D3822|nr:helix-turn-helix domain-containing protein [Janthinobacterium sp.]